MAKGEIEKTEKITINLGLVDLGQIDLLVQEGFYANRTDFIRTAIRNQLATRSEALDQTAARRTLTLGSSYYTRRDLEEIRDAGQMIHIRVLGLASIADDVSPQLALATIASVEVLGAFRAPTAVKAALAPRTALACVAVITTAARNGRSLSAQAVLPGNQEGTPPMDAPQMKAMTEATRLTREGRLAEATALIQQTLASPGAPWRTPNASSAAEETGTTPGRFPDPPQALPAGQGTKLRRAIPGWLTRRTLPSQDNETLVRPSRPAAPAENQPVPPAVKRSAARAVKRPAGQFEAFSYANAAGTRDYRLYVPSGHDSAPLPLVVMLHGGTQDAATFAAATGMNDLAERQGFLVAYPEQPASANPGKYWNWFVPGHQRRDAGEPSLIAGITRQVIERYGADASRVYVAGFSAGGAMAAVMATVYPDLYAAAGVHSGLPYAAAGDMASAFAAMKQGSSRPAGSPGRPVPLIVFHGDRDTTVAAANAAALIGDVLGAASPDTPPAVVTTGQVPGGHAYTRTRYQDPAGAALAERWIIHQGGHNWSGGVAHGSYTDPRGPDASAELLRFFDEHPARSE
jgi:poly(hydroxyalkanoate) depolymerase family esterase